MIKRNDTPQNLANPDLADTGEGNEIPRRLRLSSREIGVAVALTLAAAMQLFWSLTKPEGIVTSANPEAAPIIRHAR
jgi:hypothetical protein